jgi:hypothetical protein
VFQLFVEVTHGRKNMASPVVWQHAVVGLALGVDRWMAERDALALGILASRNDAMRDVR